MEEDVNLNFDGYDEDLNENPFFKYIQNKQKALYDEIAKQRLIVCIPRKGTLSQSNHTLDDVESHLLQLLEGEVLHGYTTLNGKIVKVNEGFILTEKGFEDVKYVRILFEETFFNSNNESFQVLCLDQPLEGGIGVSADPVVQALDNLQGCIDFLWPSTGTKQGQKQIDDIIRLFNSTYQQLEGESLRHLMDATNAIYTRAMQAALKNSQLRKLSQRNKSYLDNIKLAIETYVIHGLYNQLMKGISCIVGNEDAALNKITRNLAEIQIRDLGIKPEICANLPRGRRILSFLNRYTSPLEKFHCLKRSITIITERKMKEKAQGTVNAITADDLLPALVFLVIKSDIPNWLANINFLHNFHFSKCGYNEFQFYLSSLEAAVEHVRSGYVSSEFKGGTPFKRLQNGIPGSSSLWQPVDHDSTKPTALDMLFEYTAQGNEEEVEKLLSNEEKENARLDKMCHPLCSCDKCEKWLSKRRNDPSAVTVFSRDDMGRTVLHVAAEYGHANLTYSLIHKGAVVNTMDYHGSTPLHMACLRGHGKVVLILLHYKADANAADNDGNTPMHLCAANGHDQCCKSLVYSDMHHRILKINVANENGDTPLHLAARWGYVDLVDLLIERGASIEARNKNKQTPLECAHSQQVSEIILDAAAAHIEKETGFLGFLPDKMNKHGFSSTSKNLGARLKGSVRSSLAGSPASSLERQSPKEVDVFLRTVADGDIEMVRFRLSLDEEDEEDGDIQCKSEQDLCHPLCQCHKCIKWQKLTQRSMERAIHVNCSNEDGITPLHVAAVRGYTPIANLLLRHGANPSAKNNIKQQTPLHLSCQYNHQEVTELMLNYSAKINVKDYKGNTPLHFCCINGHLATALVLLERNVNVDAQNDRGNTPLHEAARWNFCELVRVLLQHGACVTIRNKMQLTPMQYARHDDVVKVLEQSERIANESSLTRRKTWAGLPSNSDNKFDVSLPNPVASQGTPPNPNPLRDQQAPTLGPRVSYSPVTKTVEMEERSRPRSLTDSSVCDTTIERPQTKLNKIFEQLEYGEVEKLQEIAKAVRAFDRKKSLKRTNTIDKSSPFFAIKPDRRTLEVLDQFDLCKEPMYDQTQRLIPPNNTPVDKQATPSSSPLLNRVRRVLLNDEDATTERRSEGPLLNRVRNILLEDPIQQTNPTMNPRNDTSSSEESSSTTQNVGETPPVGSGEAGAVLESVHPELVAIVEKEISDLDQGQGPYSTRKHGSNLEVKRKDFTFEETHSTKGDQISTCRTIGKLEDPDTCQKSSEVANVKLVQNEEIKSDKSVNESESIIDEMESSRSSNEENKGNNVNIDLAESFSTESNPTPKSQTDLLINTFTEENCEKIDSNQGNIPAVTDRISCLKTDQTLETGIISNEGNVEKDIEAQQAEAVQIDPPSLLEGIQTAALPTNESEASTKQNKHVFEKDQEESCLKECTGNATITDTSLTELGSGTLEEPTREKHTKQEPDVSAQGSWENVGSNQTEHVSTIEPNGTLEETVCNAITSQDSDINQENVETSQLDQSDQTSPTVEDANDTEERREGIVCSEGDAVAISLPETTRQVVEELNVGNESLRNQKDQNGRGCQGIGCNQLKDDSDDVDSDDDDYYVDAKEEEEEEKKKEENEDSDDDDGDREADQAFEASNVETDTICDNLSSRNTRS